MRSDAKLGLAMGILVTGFALAFCFPRENLRREIPNNAEKQADPETLNLRPLREHISFEAETLRSSESNASEISAETGATLSHQDQACRRDTQATSTIRNDSEHAEISLAELIDLNQSNSQAVNSESSPEADRSVNARPANRFQATYVVKSGDTLSGIAYRTLGRSSRFDEIYQANRDRLNSPDDLRPGLELRIPTAISDLVSGSESQNDLTNEDDSPSENQAQPENPAISKRPQQLPVNAISGQRPQTHQLVIGDTIEKISVKYYGTVRAARDILRANPEIDPRRLQLGDLLVLP